MSTDPSSVALSYLAAFATADPDAIASHVAADFRNEHTAALGSSCIGATEYRRRLPGFLADFADLSYDVVEVVADNVPPGLGAPIYAKLDQDICANLMSINAVKGVEIGNGFGAASISGELNADEMRIGENGEPVFLSNNAGGILGGISTGQPVVARFAVKPTSSILNERRSIDSDGREVDVKTKGRHDPCVGIRAVPIGEAMVACALADHYLRDRGQTGRLD